MRERNFDGKTALVSGASRGVGFATAAELANRRANLVITARGGERLESSRAKLAAAGARVVAVSGDVGNWEDARRMVQAAVDTYGGLDILVNNAGLSMRGAFRDLAPATCASVIGTNLVGSVYLTRAAVEHLACAGGSIVFVSSIAGIIGLPGASVYCASKRALAGLAESLRLELADDHVHVGVVNLGFTEHDPDKRIIAADGSLVAPDRPAHHTQSEAAKKIVDVIARRKNTVTLTPIGKAGQAVYRLSPRIVESAILAARSSRLFKAFS